jgi:hypothetical protein
MSIAAIASAASSTSTTEPQPDEFSFDTLQDAPGEDDAGGRVIAALFTEGDRDKLALAWSRSWDRAAKGERGAVTLVQDSADGEALTSLFEQAKGATDVGRRARTKRERDAARGRATPERSLPVRRLKQLENLSEKTVAVVSGTTGSDGKKNRRRGLRNQVPAGKQIGGSSPAPQSAPLAYSDEEKEHLALQVLQLAINGDSAGLRDYRHLRGIGADALDKLRRYFELKTTYGPLPDEVTFTANEAERAFREGEKFFLAVVAGLEEGYETVVKIIPNPLRTLEFKPSTSVTLSGITGGTSALEVRFPSRGDEASVAKASE